MPWKLSLETAAVLLCMLGVFRGIAPVFETLAAFAHRRKLVCISAGLLVLLVRAALLPVWPVPRPSIYDEFSYLLQADTFAHGRLANKPHPQWQFFETVYVLQQPTYASKYPPGQALMMAAGQVATGIAWAGVWLSCGLLAAALCWALQGWLPPVWALFGALIAVDLCLFSYWMNSYWGGAVAATGGALIIGAYGRVTRGKPRRRPGKHLGWLFGAGLVILLFTRPYEGFLLAAPTAIALWMGTKGRRTQIWLPVVALGVAGIAWTAFYDYRVTGHALRMPYQEYFNQYESVPPLTILPVQHTKSFRHFDLEFMDTGWTRDTNLIARSWRLPWVRTKDLFTTVNNMFGDSILVVIFLAFSPLWLRRKRLRLLVVLAGILVAGAMLELIFYTHYAAPFTAVLLILLMEALRYLRIWARQNLPGGRVGANLLILVLCLSVAGAGAAARTFHIFRGDSPERRLAANARKGMVEQNLLARQPGKHVIFVRYTGTHSPHEEWIYNLANIDAQPVVWAQDMGAENNQLMAYYTDRSFWMFQPDVDSNYLVPYRKP
jgi:hypothetical protein